MRLTIAIIFLSFLIALVRAVENYDDIEAALKSYPRQTQSNKKQRRPKFVYFKFKQEKLNEVDRFSKILYSFMATTGVRPHFVKVKEADLVGVVAEDAEIDIGAIKETFDDVIEDVYIKARENPEL